MKKLITIVAFSLSCYIGVSQVGINNTAPQASLDITSSSVSVPSNTDGILIPRINEFPVTAPTAAQDGMLVFVTGAGVPTKGFHFWDNGTTSWILVGGGGTDTQNTLDEAYDEGGVGAGRIITADTGALEIQDTGGLRVEGDIVAAENIVHDGDANTFIGFTDDRVEIDAGGTNYMNIQHANSRITFNEDSNELDFRIESGTNQNMLFVDGSTDRIGIGTNTPGNPFHIGIRTTFNTSVSNTGQDGIFIRGSGTSGINQVGGSISFGGAHPARDSSRRAAIASMQTGNDEDNVGLAFYVHGGPINTEPMVEGMRLTHNRRLGINNNSPSANLDVIGSLQYEDGNEATGFVLTSDAAGNASWVDPATIVSLVEKIDDLTDGKSDNDGTQDGSSIFFGIDAGLNDDATDNKNNGLGFEALSANTTGSDNIAIGHLSLRNNVDGNNNVALGNNAMRINSSGNSNTAVGSLALENNTNGGVNVAVGTNSLNANTSGGSNTAVGGASMLVNTSGEENAVLGSYTMSSNSDGSNNTIAGHRAFAGSTTGDNNTALGHRAMNSSSQGDLNVAIGKSTGYYVGGNQNTLIGANAGGDVGTGSLSGSVFLGYRAGFSETTSNKLYIENSSGNSNNALIYGEFDNDILRINGELQVGNIPASRYAFPTADGAANYVLQTDGSGQLSFVDGSTLDSSDWSLTGNTVIGGQFIGSTNNVDVPFRTNNVEKMRLTSRGQLEFYNTGDSVFIGEQAGENDDFSNNQNTGVGNLALRDNTTGSYNTAMGYLAMRDNITGNRNVATGYAAMANNESGQYNVSMGSNSLSNNIDGDSNMAVGYQALSDNVSGNGNIAIGHQALTDNLANRNIGIGDAAGSRITTGTGNIGIGYRAQASHTVGNDNIAIGNAALDTMTSLTNASGNIAIGTDAMSNLTEGSSNVAIGQFALYGNGNGAPNFASNNVAIGAGAGQNTEGDGNIFVGYNAGRLNPFSNNRLFIENSNGDEDDALIYGEFDNDLLRINGELEVGNNPTSRYAFPIADGTANYVLQTDGSGQLSFVDGSTLGSSGWSLTGNAVAGGQFIGSTNNVDVPFRTNNVEKMRLTAKGQLEFFNTGSSVFMGELAGENDDLTNNLNTLIGYSAGTAIIDGFRNAAVGYDALRSTTSGERNAVLGAGSLVANTSGSDNIAIGGSVMVSNTTESRNIAIGYAAFFEKEGGNSNVAIGYRAGAKDITSDQNVYIGHEAGGGFVPDPDENKSGNVFVGYRAGYDVNGDDQLMIENSDSTTGLIYGDFSTNEVGINWNATTALPNTLSVNGNASKSAAGSWLANSDRRLKKDIKTISGESALDKLKRLRGVTYLWNDVKTGIERPSEIQYGFVAQEIMEVFPEKVSMDNLGYYQTAYGDYDALFVQAIKEQQIQIESLSKENKKLKIALEKVNALEARLSILENSVDQSTKIPSEKLLSEKK